MEINKTYIKFLNIINALDASPYSPQIDIDAKKLLEAIVLRVAEQRPLTVNDAMALNAIGSPVTIRRKLDQLRELGMIDMVFKDQNRRTKHLMPTNDALTYFNSMGKAVKAAADIDISRMS